MSQNPHFIKIGDKVRCKVTGFTGTATARVEYINGCVQFAVTPRIAAEGEAKYPECQYLDEGQLELVVESAVPAVSPRLVGGPQVNTPPV